MLQQFIGEVACLYFFRVEYLRNVVYQTLFKIGYIFFSQSYSKIRGDVLRYTVCALLHCALSLTTQCIVIGPVCDSGVCNGRAGGRAGGVRTLLQPARAQCLRLSERFFHCIIFVKGAQRDGVFW